MESAREDLLVQGPLLACRSRDLRDVMQPLNSSTRLSHPFFFSLFQSLCLCVCVSVSLCVCLCVSLCASTSLSSLTFEDRVYETSLNGRILPHRASVRLHPQPEITLLCRQFDAGRPLPSLSPPATPRAALEFNGVPVIIFILNRLFGGVNLKIRWCTWKKGKTRVTLRYMLRCRCYAAILERIGL